MSGAAIANPGVTISAVGERLTTEEAVKLLSQLVGREIKAGSLRRMLHDQHPAVRQMLRYGVNKQRQWRWTRGSVIKAAELWPNFRGRPRKDRDGT